MQVQLLYNLRHLIDHDLRNTLMSYIIEARSPAKMIEMLRQTFVTLDHDNEIEVLKPFLLRLKDAIEFATDGSIKFYSKRENYMGVSSF